MTPSLKHAVITRELVNLWRQASDYQTGRIAILFGVQTALWFDGLDPADFDHFASSEIGEGLVLLDRAETAPQLFADLHPGWEIIF